MYCRQYDLIQLHRQIIHQNDMVKYFHEKFIETITQNLKKTMKMTLLHMEFVLIFITSPSQAKLGRTAQQQLLTLALLDGSYHNWKKHFRYFDSNPRGVKQHCYKKKAATVGQNGRLSALCNFFSF